MSLGGFAYPFLMAGAGGTPAFVLLPRVRGNGSADAELAVQLQMRNTLRAILSQRLVPLISLATAGQYFCHGALIGFFPLYAREVTGLAAWRSGLLFGAQTGSIPASRPLVGTLAGRVGRPPLMLAGIVASAACG